MKKITVYKKKWVCAVGLTVVAFLLLSAFSNGKIFPSDEEEIFLKGRAIANGFSLYTDIGSQHMPVMYYIAAVFARLGVETITMFRLCFYMVMALLWGLCYYCYSHKLGRAALALYPIVNIVLISYADYGNTILSDHFQGIGMAILFFELLVFHKDRTLRIGNCLMISLAIFISFGSAFVALFAIFAVGLTVLCIESRDCKNHKLGVGKSLAHLIRRYWKLVVIVAIPFVIMLGYYAATGAVREFYGWVYQINRTIYPKYLKGDYGGSILKSLFNGISILGLEMIPETLTLSFLCKVVVLLIVILYIVHQHKQHKDKLFTAGIIFFLITSATRGMFDFHGLPVLALFAAMIALYIAEKREILYRFYNTSTVKRSVAVLCAILLCAPYLKSMPNIVGTKNSHDVTELSQAVDTLTEKNEHIGFSTMDYDVLMNADVFPATITSASCPWLWDYGGAQMMQELKEEPPRVYLLNKNSETWGHKIVDYAPDLIEFIDSKYSSFENFGYPTLYVLDETYLTSARKLNEDIVFTTKDDKPLIVELTKDVVLSQTFTADTDAEISSVGIKVGTHARVNNCTLNVSLTDQTTGETITLSQIDCANIVDNMYCDSIFEKLTLKAGHSYKLTLTSPDATENNSIAIYHDRAGANEDAYAAINGESENFNLCLKISKQ